MTALGVQVGAGAAGPGWEPRCPWSGHSAGSGAGRGAAGDPERPARAGRFQGAFLAGSPRFVYFSVSALRSPLWGTRPRPRSRARGFLQDGLRESAPPGARGKTRVGAEGARWPPRGAGAETRLQEDRLAPAKVWGLRGAPACPCPGPACARLRPPGRWAWRTCPPGALSARSTRDSPRLWVSRPSPGKENGRCVGTGTPGSCG